MDFGKLHDLAGVRFDLPPLPARARARLQAGPPPAPGRWLRLGAPAWARRDWVGKLYPSGTPPRDFLRLYARACGAIELNASFYNVPEPHVLDGWAADTPPDFVFVPKLHRDVTHAGPLAPRLAEGVAAHFARLGPRLGPFLVQLPPWFSPADLPALDELLAALAAPAHVEFRHEAFFAGGELHPAAAALLERHRAGAVVTDVAGRRDVCHATLTGRELLVRFVGNGLHPTDLTRVDAWMARLAELRAAGLERCFFFVHQPDDHLAPELLRELELRARAHGLPVFHPVPRGQLSLL